MSEQARRTCSSIDRLPEDVRVQLDQKLANPANSFIELSVWLKEQGFEISKSAVGRYSQRTKKTAERVIDTLQRTKAIAAAVEAHPELDYTRAASMVMMDGLMRRVSSAEEEFEEMPLDKAGRLIASLSRNATYEKRTPADLKKKAELAFGQLEEKMLETVKGSPELARRMRDLLIDARQMILAEE